MNTSPAFSRLQQSEIALLLVCANPCAATERGERLRQLAGECRDWEFVIEAARRHGITALVSANLDRVAGDLVPQETLRALRQRFRANGQRNLFLMQELLRVVRELGAAGIPVIPFKGPMLAITGYGNVALREFMDLDILVPRENFEAARRVLASRGYRQPDNQTDDRESAHIESQLGCDFFREEGRISVELHWSFIQKWLGFAVDLKAVWSGAKEVDVAGARVLTLSPEILLLYLCAHGTKHRWSRLCWVVDVAQVLRCNPGIDWNSLIGAAERMGCRRTLFLGLSLVQRLLAVEIPAGVAQKICLDSAVAGLAQELTDEMFSSVAGPQRTNLEKDWFHLCSKERWRDRLRFARYWAGWLLAPSQRDKHWVDLPEKLHWLYFLLRPVRVAVDRVRPRFRS